jgi:hypothetical protein
MILLNGFVLFVFFAANWLVEMIVRGSALGVRLRELRGPLTKATLRDPSSTPSSLRSGCAQQHVARGAEHGPSLITSDHGKLVEESLHGLIVLEKLEEQTDRHRRSDKDRTATGLSAVSFNRVFKFHVSRPPSPQKRPSTRAARASADSTWPPTRLLKLGYQFKFAERFTKHTSSDE